MPKHATGRGSEGMPLTFGPKWCFSEARQQSFTCMSIYLPAYCAVQRWFWLFDRLLIRKLHPSQMSLVRLIVHSEEQKVVGRKTRKRFFCTVCSHLNMSPPNVRCVYVLCRNWLGIHWSMALIGDTKQTMSEGKSDPVEIELIWLVTTALQLATPACYHVYFVH